MPIRFDESLPKLVSVVLAELGPDATSKATFVRDARGQLSVVIDDELGDACLDRFEALANSALGAYARDDGVVRDRSSFGSKRLLSEGANGRRVVVASQSIAFLDRRTVGADWLLPPHQPSAIPRIAFASLKGGVGRSTALAVLAAYLSARGLRVLAVDLDLEAPGIGTMLVNHDALPRFGTLDYLIENGLGGIDDEFISDCIGSSFLGETGAQVTVFPAIGTSTIDNPAEAISKLGRAYLEDLDGKGDSVSLTAQIREMLDRATGATNCDVVLIDARAGLHETTAAALLGLGAEVLLFGANEPQTFLGYRLLLSHLLQFHGGEYDSWRDRLQFVHAKAAGDPAEIADAASKFGDLYNLIHGVADNPDVIIDLTEDDFAMSWAEDEVDIEIELNQETKIIKILDDSNYRGFDPLNKRNLLHGDLFELTFGELIEWLNDVVPALTGLDDGV